jgi:hypothetical protein
MNPPAMGERSLRDIALAVGTDKETAHSYATAYERHLGHLRDRPIRLLEIGVGGYSDPHAGGASLRMWKEFFPRGEIVGVDIHDKSALAEPRITIVQGDQSDGEFLDDVATRYGPFDVIVDDGSHICAHVIKSFRHLFGSLTDGGTYAIEDLQTSYWERGYGGSSGGNRRGTSMTMLKSLVDGLNYAEFDIANYAPTEFDRNITSLTFYHNLVFIQKGPNLEPSNSLAPHPRPASLFAVEPTSSAGQGTRGRVRRWARRYIPKGIRSAVVGWVRRP